MPQQKNVRFDHLEPQYSTFGRDGNPPGIHPFFLGHFLTAISQLDDMHRTLLVINGDMYRFQRCIPIEIGLWEIQILHLRQKILPGYADEFGEFQEVINLPEGQFPAESTTLLYSEATQVLYVQRNVYGISIKNLEEYFTRLIFRPGTPEATNRILLPIQTNDDGGRTITGQTRYKKLILCANVDGVEDCRRDGTLRDILEQFRALGATVANIDISIGRRRNIQLAPEAIAELIDEASRYAGTTKLQAKMADPDDVTFTMYDLLENKKYYTVTIHYSRENPISHARLMTGLLAEYRQYALVAVPVE